MIPLPLSLALAATLQADDGPTGFPGTPLSRPTVEIAWNRLYPIDELYAHFDGLVAVLRGVASA